MEWLQQFDKYTRAARIKPLLLVALPIGLAAAPWISAESAVWSGVGGLVAWGGGAALIAQLSRDPGKRKEKELFRKWGGTPTTRLLRHRDVENKALLEARHQRLGDLITDVRMPTHEEEKQDPEAADHVYERCVSYLRESTRDKEQFPLVFEELCNYGFRRNTWGMRPLGISVALAGLIVGTVAIVLDAIKAGIGSVDLLAVTASIGNVALVIVWITLVSEQWVRVAADAYADQLLSAVDRL